MADMIDKAEVHDDDLIRRGDVLRLLIGTADIQRGPSTDKQRMIRALPARGVGVKPLEWINGVTTDRLLATTVILDAPEDQAAYERNRAARILAALEPVQKMHTLPAPTAAAQAREAALLQRAAQLAYEVWDDPEALAKAILALGKARDD